MQRVYRKRTVLKSEHLEQVDFVSWFRKSFSDEIIAIPNGGSRSRSEGARLKAEGVKAGVSDLFVPAWLLWIEFKRSDGGRGLSADQKKWANYVESIGHHFMLCNGYDEAVNKVTDFYKSNQK